MENIKVYGLDNMGGQIVDQWGTYKRNKRDIIEKIKYNNVIYTLKENINGFYNKALIYENNNNYILMSYDTIVAEYNGEYLQLSGYYSETTKRHINYFLEKFNFETMNKRTMIESANKKIYK